MIFLVPVAEHVLSVVSSSVSVSALPAWLDPDYLINTFGLFGLVGFIFMESWLLPLPGDSLLFTAGLLVASGVFRLNLVLLIVILTGVAIVGNLTGYGVGRAIGPALFKNPDARLFKPRYIEAAHGYYQKYGSKTIVIARFIPFVRAIATVVAGASRMNLRLFAVWSVLGGALWIASMTVLGYFLGQISFVRNHVELIVVIVAVVPAIPILIEVFRRRNATRNTGT